MRMVGTKVAVDLPSQTQHILVSESAFQSWTENAKK